MEKKEETIDTELVDGVYVPSGKVTNRVVSREVRHSISKRVTRKEDPVDEFFDSFYGSLDLLGRIVSRIR